MSATTQESRKARAILLVLVALIFSIGIPSLWAADVNDIGDWLQPDEGTLAEAVQDAAPGDTVVLQNDLNASWPNWVTAGGYTILQLGTPNQAITFELNGHILAGAPLDIGSGDSVFTFQNGVLGSAAANFVVGATGGGSANLENVNLLANVLQLGGSGSGYGTLRATNGSSITASSLNATGMGSMLYLDNSTANISGTANLIDGGNLTVLSGSTATIGGDVTVSGVAAVDTGGGNYTFSQSTIQGNGTLVFTGDNFTINNGGKMDFTNFVNFATGGVLEAGKTFTISGIFSHAPSGKSFRTEGTINGDLTINGGVVRVDGGALLQGGGTGISSINVTSGGRLTVSGGVDDKDSGNEYVSTIIVDNGDLTVDGVGQVSVEDGGLIDGVKDIYVGGAGGPATLNVFGVNANTEEASTIRSASGGLLSVGSGGAGAVNLGAGGVLDVGNAVIGNDQDGILNVLGVGTLDKRSTLNVVDFSLGGTSTATLSIRDGALLNITGMAILGLQSGGTSTVSIGGVGGVGASYNATLQTADNLIVGNAGNVDVAITAGGSVVPGGSTVAGIMASSQTTIAIDAAGTTAWIAGGSPVLPGAYQPPQGNTKLTVNGGTMRIDGLFAMSGRSSTYANDFGIAAFNNGSELAMNGGSFYNQNQGATLGKIFFNSGSIVSGEGEIYAGEQIVINGGTIAGGTRWMYDFDQGLSNGNKLTSLGTIHFHDRVDVATQFYNTTFLTELDRDGTPANANGLSDRAVVHGDLDVDSDFKVSISRPLDGQYLLVQAADGGAITNFTPQQLSSLGATDMSITLNGKLVKGNDRLDHPGGLVTELRGNNEIWLTVDTGGMGNVKTWWTGAADGTWNMQARNFDAKDDAPFAGDDQFLDGDIVVFDFNEIDADKRTANVTTDATHYSGNLSSVANVAVAEVQVLNGTGTDTRIVWNGGSIFAYNSALYSTLDLIGNGSTPSGRLVKIGEGTLEINNANEFYGGIHLGDAGTTGGLIILNNEKGFGTYNSGSGYIYKGQVYVHENTVIDVSGLNGGAGGTINNRFVIDPDKILTFDIGNSNLTVAGNNSMYSDNGGKGGGIFIGNQGQVNYTGTGTLTLDSNIAHKGGGIYSEHEYIFNVPVDVENNYANQQGGGIYAEKNFVLSSGADVTGNAAQGAGGGIYVGNVGGDGTQFVIHGNTAITNNLSGASQGGGVYVEADRILAIDTAKSVAGSIMAREFRTAV